MRPYIDITHATHGRVKDYAEREGIEPSEAYEVLLDAGLAADPNPNIR